MTQLCYNIDINERGEFRASVWKEGKLKDTLIFSVYSDLIEDGFMKHANDVLGLQAHLRNMAIIGKSDIIINQY